MKHSLLRLFAVLLVLGIFAPLHAQIDSTGNVSTSGTRSDSVYYGVGFRASLLSGAGLAGRMYFPRQRLTAQLAFIVITVPGSTYTTHLNVGGEIQYTFVNTDEKELRGGISRGRVYSMLGMGLYHTGSDRPDLPGNRIANPFRIGIGLGYDLPVGNVVFELSGALTFFPTTSEFLPLPQIGMYYNFR